MQIKKIEWHQERAERLREKLQAEPGTPADRIILKPGMAALTVNQTIRQLKRHEDAIKRFVADGLKK